MSLITINPRRYVSRFIKRLEKKGYITKAIKGANYRKVRILSSNDDRTRRIIFITKGGLEIYVDIDVFSLSLDPATYLNNSYRDVKTAINLYKDKVREKENAEHSDTGSSHSAS